MSIPIVTRHPDTSQVMALHEKFSWGNQGISLPPPPGNQSSARLEAMNLSASDLDAAYGTTGVLLSSEMGAMLTQAFGPHDGIVNGKYRDAQVFGFKVNNEVVLAITEAGDRGSMWVWMPKESHPAFTKSMISDADNPMIAHFWPDLVEGLMAAIGHPLTRPDLTFLSNSSPSARYEAKQLEAALPLNGGAAEKVASRIHRRL